MKRKSESINKNKDSDDEVYLSIEINLDENFQLVKDPYDFWEMIKKWDASVKLNNTISK